MNLKFHVGYVTVHNLNSKILKKFLVIIFTSRMILVAHCRDQTLTLHPGLELATA